MRTESGEGIDIGASQIYRASPVPPLSEALTPASEAFREDLTSFGHELKVAMVDEISRESLDEISSQYSSNW